MCVPAVSMCAYECACVCVVPVSNVTLSYVNSVAVDTGHNSKQDITSVIIRYRHHHSTLIVIH